MDRRKRKGRVPLTVDKVVDILKQVKNGRGQPWLWVGTRLLWMTSIKINELTPSSSLESNEERLRKVVHFWLSRCPYASWRWLVWRLESEKLLELADQISPEPLHDPTLTLINVSNTVRSVRVDAIRECLNVPDCKENEILRLYTSTSEHTTSEKCKMGLISWWLNKSPFAGWEELAGCLYQQGEGGAVLKIKTFLRQPNEEHTVNLVELCDILKTAKNWTAYSNLRLVELLHIQDTVVQRLQGQYYATMHRNGFDVKPYLKQYVERHPAPTWRGVAHAIYVTAGFEISATVDCFTALECIYRRYLVKDLNLQELCKEAILTFVGDEDVDLLPLPKRIKHSIKAT